MKRRRGYPERFALLVLEDVRVGASSGEAAIDHGIPRGTVDCWIKRYFGSIARLRRKRKPLTGEQA